ncbi:uncharacterized protein FOMMEDRAFT_167326 [Fomitiporia mediterranea MF3/22]|uniref:uncharacterized protein n=1 Tax=Fomitiporia mediterranea (strain MF3/22) TaxID=694068 RepID=UPI0004407DFE|nr:uncharacterized protein FOMMEDRAFT_167326 [Fomitiporia mediterranea MF3/22]EJD04045.1 hypothetical protein FOMMEDRAFT_167326 [Fomitiporia mediterranea MF3/22]
MGPWPLFLKRIVITRGVIKVPQEEVLNVLKDPPTVITLNPLVAYYEVKPEDPSTYVITDTIKMPFFTTKTTYTARVEFGENRTTFHVKASGGMTSTNHWTSKRRDEQPDTTEVVEESHVEAPFFLMPFIVGNIRKSHRELMDRLTVKLESKQKRSGEHT